MEAIKEKMRKIEEKDGKNDRIVFLIIFNYFLF